MAAGLAFDPVREMVRWRVQTLKKEQFELSWGAGEGVCFPAGPAGPTAAMLKLCCFGLMERCSEAQTQTLLKLSRLTWKRRADELKVHK